MGKKIEKKNFRLEVYTNESIFGNPLSQEYIVSKLEDMKQEIKRHVDNVNYVSIMYDTEESCEFCGWHWNKNDVVNTGSNFCCDKELEEAEKNGFVDKDGRTIKGNPNGG